MKRSVLVLAATILVGGTVGAPSRTSAEAFMDLFIGGAFTDDTVLEGVQVPMEDSVAGGIRGGYWFEGAAKWIGLGLDVSYFGPSVDESGTVAEGIDVLTLHTIPITPLAMLRIPLLTGDEFKNGRIQPYGAIGPGLFTSLATSDLVPDTIDVGFGVGLDARVGVSAMLTQTLGLYVEYRYTDVDVEFSSDGGPKIKIPLQSNHINGGITLRF